MPLQDSISRAANTAKWKADQQIRLLKSQSQARDLEEKIKAQKAKLADAALTLFAQQGLSEDELKQICSAIAQLHENIQQQRDLQEAIKNELPPDQVYSSHYPPTNMPTETPKSGQLVCPKCGKVVPIRFCPDHGVEGIPVP